MGKLTISIGAIFHSELLNYQRVCFEVASVVKYDEHGFATRTKEQTSDDNIEISWILR